MSSISLDCFRILTFCPARSTSFVRRNDDSRIYGITFSIPNDPDIEKPHNLFGFLRNPNLHLHMMSRDWSTASADYLPETEGEDYEEMDFVKRMKKKRKRRQK